MSDDHPSIAVVGLITGSTMFDPMLLADPTFAPAWCEFTEEWRDEKHLPLYLALAQLARHLITDLERGDTARFPEIFNVVERWHVEGDSYVREAASIGLLEDLQNTGLHRTTSPENFLRWLGPNSRRWWDKVDVFWRDGTPIRPD